MFYRQIFHSTLAKVIQGRSWGGVTKQWNIIEKNYKSVLSKKGLGNDFAVKYIEISLTTLK